MEEVAAIVKAIAALNVVRNFRDSPDLYIAEDKLSSLLDLAMTDWIGSEAADLS